MDKYVLSNVANCTFTFSDGEKSSVASSPNKEIVVVKLIPRTSADKLFQEYIVRVFSSCKNAAELAKRCGYDCQKTFTRHFKKSFGETPYKWMLDRKMEEIRLLVLNSDISLRELAHLYDFKNITHLVNAYKNRFGVAPLKSRALATSSAV